MGALSAQPAGQSSETMLSELTWPVVQSLTDSGAATLLVPLGSCEQHGPHLPFDTDTRIASALCDAVIRLDDHDHDHDHDCGPAGQRLVAPAIGVGASGEHQSFPGTLSIGTSALVSVLVELVRSALPGPPSTVPASTVPASTVRSGHSGVPSPFSNVVIVNGHGGNIDATRQALEVLRSEGRRVSVWHPQVPGGDSHAGRTETSILLAIDPQCVRVEAIEVGSTARWRDIGEQVRREGLGAVTANGVLGDPTGATVEEGHAVFDALVADLDSHVRAAAVGS